MVLFGGGSLNDTWVWDGAHWSEQHRTIAPPPRAYASMAYDAATHQLILFGGISPSGDAIGDTWLWDGTAWQQAHPSASPSPRADAVMAYDASTQQMVLFGGQVPGSGHTTVLTNEQWNWDGQTWKQQSAARFPTARADASLAYDAAHQELVLFGGFTGSGVANDTWTWNGRVWQEQQPARSPTARSHSCLVYDDELHQSVLFAGVDQQGNAVDDTWLWNGVTWIQRPNDDSPANPDGIGAYDRVHGVVITYIASEPKGGSNTSQTWVWTPAADWAPAR